MSLFRLQSRGGRYYADLSKYGGPSLKAMIPDGERRATHDEDVAADLYNRWKKYYIDGQRRRHLGLTKLVTLGDFARRYIEDRARGRARFPRKIKPHTLEKYARDLDAVLVPYFGARTPLGAITAGRVDEFIAWRLGQPSRKKGSDGRVTAGTVQRELCVLSSVFELAIRRDIVFENPVRKAGWLEREPPKDVFLEPAEAWALLEAAASDVYPYARPLVAVMLYGGLRQLEARGLEARDVDRDARLIRVRDNRFRSVARGGIKYAACVRKVPLWPDLTDWLPARLGRAPLFPTPGDDDRPLSHNLEKLFRRLTVAAEIRGKHITPHVLRHTWCAMRLQTLDGGAPVSPFTVMREGGWTSLRMVERVYGHLPEHRLRLPVLTYRPEGMSEVKHA